MFRIFLILGIIFSSIFLITWVAEAGTSPPLTCDSEICQGSNVLCELCSGVAIDGPCLWVWAGDTCIIAPPTPTPSPTATPSPSPTPPPLTCDSEICGESEQFCNICSDLYVQDGPCEWTGTSCIQVPMATPEPSGPIVIIPTMGQWGMLFVTLLLGLFAVLRLRSRIRS